VSRGCSGTRAITEFDASQLAARWRRRSAASPSTTCRRSRRRYLGPRLPRRSEALLAHRADRRHRAREAWADAGPEHREPNAGVVIGSGGGGIDVGERNYLRLLRRARQKVTPYAIPVSIVGMLSSEISISLRLRGVSHVLSCGCTSSTDAMGYAAGLLRSGEADIVLSGGADAVRDAPA
jgi:3-oxoacyl-[acyl-carrier-protein] synthase II